MEISQGKALRKAWDKKRREVKRKIREMSMPQLGMAFLRLLLQLITVIYVFCMLAILPIYFRRETGYSFIGSNKSDFFMDKGFFLGRVFIPVFVFYAVFALLCFLWENRTKKGKFSLFLNFLMDNFSLTDKFAILYTIGVLLSYYYTDYRVELRLGAQGWYMGLLPQLLLIGSYFAVSRFLPKCAVKWTSLVLLAVPCFVFATGLLNRYGVNLLGIPMIGPGFISTIGNINWYCGYWTAVYPVAVGCFVFYEGKAEKEKRSGVLRAAFGFAAAVGFASGITQGSESGVLALAAVLLLVSAIAVKRRERLRRFLELLLIFCLTACLLSVVQWLFPERNQYMTMTSALLTGTALPWAAGILLLCVCLWMKSSIFEAGKGYQTDKCVGADKNETRAERYERRIRRGWYLCLFLIGMTIVSYIVLLIINTLHPGSIGALSDNPLFVFDREWGSSRGGTWKAGIRAWTSLDSLHKVVGIGPDGMAEYIYKGPDSGLLAMVQSQFGNNRLTNAHGEWITILANLGVIGLVGFAGMVVSAILRFLRAGEGKPAAESDTKNDNNVENKHSYVGGALCMACGLALFGYTVNNSFSFQQVMNVSQMFIILGLGEWMKRKEREREDGGYENPDCRG